jgi:hypothetical protein
MSVTHSIAGTNEIIGDFETSHLVRGRLVSSHCAQFAAVVIRKNVPIGATGVKKESDPARHLTDTVTTVSAIVIVTVTESVKGNAIKKGRKIVIVIGKTVISDIAKKKKMRVVKNVTGRNDHIVEIVTGMTGDTRKSGIKTENVSSSRPTM